MEAKDRGRHRLGGKHSSGPIHEAEEKKITGPSNKPSGRRAARPVPAPPTRSPAIHRDTVATPEDKTGLIRVVRHKRYNALAALATGGLLIVGGSATAAHKPAPMQDNERSATASDLELELGEGDEGGPITVPIDVILEQEMVEVKTSPAPPPPPPAPVVKKVAPVAPAPVAKPVVPKAAPAPAPAVPASGRAALIASAAMGQLGVTQDCTRLATKALAAAGISHHGWPASYLSLGTQVSERDAVPGDLIYYANGGMGLAHIAVYIGNGQAVHGGWNGNQTVIFKANVGSGPVFIRV